MRRTTNKVQREEGANVPWLIRSAVAAIVIAAAPVAAFGGDGGFYDGRMLLERCRIGVSDQEKAKHGVRLVMDGECTGYVLGVVDAVENCLPAVVTFGELRGVVLTWLEKHPQHRHLQAADLIQAALFQAYPCK